MSTTARVETRGDGVVVLHLAVPGGAHVELPMGRGEAHELGSLLLDAGDEPAPLLPAASTGDVQVFAGRAQTRVVGEGPPAGWVGLPEARAIAAIAGFEQAISETGQRIAEGAELDAERAGRVCQHDTIRVEDHDGILRCAGCQEPTPRGAR